MSSVCVLHHVKLTKKWLDGSDGITIDGGRYNGKYARWDIAPNIILFGMTFLAGVHVYLSSIFSWGKTGISKNLIEKPGDKTVSEC